MTNQTSPFPGVSRPPRRKPNFWLRATPLQRVGVVAAALVLPCCGGVAVIGSLAGGKRPVVATAPAGLTPGPDGFTPGPDGFTPGSASGRLAGERKAPTPAGPVPPGATPTRKITAPAQKSRAPHPALTKRTTTQRTAVAYPTRTVPDNTLAKGDTRVRTGGATGVRTRTYKIVLAGGKEISRELVRSVVTKRPVTKVVAVGTRVEPADDGCDPNYTPCVPTASDVDCEDSGGDGPAYVAGPVQVIGDDIYNLDRDGDNVACDA